MTKRSLIWQIIVWTVAVCAHTAEIAFAQEDMIADEQQLHVECAYKGRVLMLSLQYPEKTALPCKVTYQRANGAAFDIWQTDNKESFCEVQFQMIVGKLIRSGWMCKEVKLDDRKRTPRRDFK